MFATRNQQIGERLAREGLDALWVTNLSNIYYLSGFDGSTAQLLITPHQRWILTDFRYHEIVAQKVDPSFQLEDTSGQKIVEELLPRVARQAGVKRIGFESANLTHAAFTKLAEIADVEYHPTKDWIEELRAIKDAGELDRLKQACELGELIFAELLGIIDANMTEADIAAEIHYRAVRYGASGVSFDPIIASGPNASKPHAGFTTAKLTPHAPLTIDMGVKLNGYVSDMTRTVFLGDCPPVWEERYHIVREAKELAFAAVKPGKLGKEIDAVAREFIYRKGYEGKFGHGLGHGLGIEVHEQPSLAITAEKALAVGHVLSNEPGIYLPGEGGIRIEDVFTVTADGARNLNESSTELMVVG